MMPFVRLVRRIVVFAACALPGASWAQYVPQPDTYLSAIERPAGLQSYAHLGAALASSGGLVAVGAPWDNTGRHETGVVKIFEAASGNLVRVLTNPVPTSAVNFGTKVAMDGSRVAVATPGYSQNTHDEHGRVYVFDLNSPNPDQPVQILDNPDPGVDASAGNSFGDSLVFAGTQLIVGASQRRQSDAEGKVYIFDLSGASPTVPIVTIPNPVAEERGGFGCALAVEGNRLVVGARSAWFETGKVYIYDLSGVQPLVPQHVLANAQPTAGDSFGCAVAISGSRVIVGAKDANLSQGWAFLFDLAGPTPETAVTQLYNLENHIVANFGSAVAISGNYAVVGRPNMGNAVLYDLNAQVPGYPVHTFSNPTPPQHDGFGFAVLMTGDRVLIGAPYDDRGASDAGSVFNYNYLNPAAPPVILNSPGPSAGDSFGTSLALSGTRMVVSSPGQGAVFVYDLASPTPTVPVTSLENPTPAVWDRFNAVAISGTKVVVGAAGDDGLGREAGRAYVYDLAGSEPHKPVFTLQPPLPAVDENFGSSVAVDGNRVLVSARGGDPESPGIVHEYHLDGLDPQLPVRSISNPSPSDTRTFGMRMSMSGNRVLISGIKNLPDKSEVGIAYVFDLESAAAMAPIVNIENPQPKSYDQFGSAMALSGTTAVIGAPGADGIGNRVGAAYVFDLVGDSPHTPVFTLRSPQASAGGYFGSSVGISGSRVAIGAQREPTEAPGNGRIHIYDLSSDTPEVAVSTLLDPSPDAYDELGSSVAVMGTTVLAGVPRRTRPMAYQGSVLLFGPSPFTKWKHEVFGDHLAPDTGDIDGDQLVNLAEYALGSSPLVPNATHLPAEAFTYPDGERLRLILQRDPARPDVGIDAQAAENMSGPWVTVASSRNGEPFQGPGYVGGDSAGPGLKTVEIRDVVNLADASRRFMRVKFTR
jgi:drug/metabolite transporter superfamily protein YnfA